MKLRDGVVSCVYYAVLQASLHGNAKVDQVGVRKLGASWVVWIHRGRIDCCG
jgi:hypothetical protein